jgi:MFS family permease
VRPGRRTGRDAPRRALAGVLAAGRHLLYLRRHLDRLIGTHLIPHANDHGIAQTTAAGMLALMGAMNFIGTLGSGWLTDRYDPRKLLAVYYGFRGVSLLFLPFVTEPFGLAAFAILFGLDYIATVPPTTALVADNFGRRNVGTVYGWVFCSHQVGAALAAWMGGMTRDIAGRLRAGISWWPVRWRWRARCWRCASRRRKLVVHWQ